MKRKICLTLVFAVLTALCACGGAKNTPSPQSTAAPESTVPYKDTVYDYVFKDDTISFRYSPLDPSADSDISAACIAAAAAKDQRFGEGAAASAIRDRADYTQAEVQACFVNGDTGRAIALMRILPVPEPEFMGMHPEYFFVIRTADYGSTWEKSDNAFCFYPGYLQYVFDGDLLCVSGYSETDGGSILVSDDGMNSCIFRKGLQDRGVGEYIVSIRHDAEKERLILTAETTNYGYFIHDGSARQYDVVCDLALNVISSEKDAG